MPTRRRLERVLSIRWWGRGARCRWRRCRRCRGRRSRVCRSGWVAAQLTHGAFDSVAQAVDVVVEGAVAAAAALAVADLVGRFGDDRLDSRVGAGRSGCRGVSGPTSPDHACDHGSSRADPRHSAWPPGSNGSTRSVRGGRRARRPAVRAEPRPRADAPARWSNRPRPSAPARPTGHPTSRPPTSDDARLETVCHGPNRARRSRHGVPVRVRWTTPSITSR